MSRVLEALRRAEASAPPAASVRPALTPALHATQEPPSAVRRWRRRRHAREAARKTRRAEAAARHAALLARLDTLERRLAELDETLTKQLGELEPHLLHAFELRSQGLERELVSIAQRAVPLAVEPRPLAVIGALLLRLIRPDRAGGSRHR